MDSPVYFRSPIETLSDSLVDGSSVSLHDVIDAYSTLSARIRSHSRTIVQSDGNLVALESLKPHSGRIHQCLRRDIKHALIDPLSDGISSEEFMTSDLFVVMADNVKNARDLLLLSRYSLRFLSDIFRFQALLSLFSNDDLSLLLEDVLFIGLRPTNYQETFSMIMWILKVQRLPSIVLSSKTGDLSSVLKRASTEQCVPGGGNHDALADSIKAVHNLLEHHPSHFLSYLGCLLPSILTHLLSDSPHIRFEAAWALQGFTWAKITCTESSGPTCDVLSHHVRSFIDSQSSTHGADVRLLTLLNSALTTENPCHHAEGPLWGFPVLASFIILLGSSIFSHPRSLKLILPSLAQGIVHKKYSVRSLHPQVWKCLVWAFSRISKDLSGSHDGRLSIRMEERAYLVVKQELRGGIGVALVSSLLGMMSSAESNVTKAIDVLKEMTFNGSKLTQIAGFSLLTRLVSSIGTSSTPAPTGYGWNLNSILPRHLLDGTVLGTKWDKLHSVLRSFEEISCEQVRQLSEMEIIQYWDELLIIWVKSVEVTLQESNGLHADLVRTWQSLLLAQAQLTQEYSHLAAPPMVASRVPSVVAAFLVPARPPASEERSVSCADQQYCQISLVNKLWTVMKNVFSMPWLSAPAEFILVALTNQRWLLDDSKVGDAWIKLCSSLISMEVPSLVHILSENVWHQAETKARRQLWTIVAQLWQSPQKVDWHDGVSFLAIPLMMWSMSDGDLGLWDGMLRSTISMASLALVGSNEVIQLVIKRLGTKSAPQLSLNPQATGALLSYIVLSEGEELPFEVFSAIDKAMRILYPPLPELLDPTLRIFSLLRNVINSAPSLCLVPLLTTMSSGICCWIEDRSEILLDEEYNDIIIPLYCDALTILHRHPPSLPTLESLSSFLSSAFTRIPPPALGPLAFEVFWKATYQQTDKVENVYPERIKMCLKALDDAFGGNLSLGVPSDSEPRTTSSAVADSNPSFDLPYETCSCNNHSGNVDWPQTPDFFKSLLVQHEPAMHQPHIRSTDSRSLLSPPSLVADRHQLHDNENQINVTLQNAPSL